MAIASHRRFHPSGRAAARLVGSRFNRLSQMADRWPHMMKAETAAQYCDLSRSAFIGEVAAGRLPSPVNLGGRDHWFRPALDRALAILAGQVLAEYEKEFWDSEQAA